MRQRTLTITAFSVSLVAASIAAITAGVLGSARPAGAVTGAVPGAPTGAYATPGPRQISVSFQEPAPVPGTRIISNTVKATDLTRPALGGQIRIVEGTVYADFATFKDLIPGDEYTFTVTATDAAGTGPSSAPTKPVTPQPSLPPPPHQGIECTTATGTISGVVTLAACKSEGAAAGGGTLPGATFVGHKTGKISWTSYGRSYSTTIETTTTLVTNVGQTCGGTHVAKYYAVTGKVTANTSPYLKVGYGVDGSLCITPTGVVKGVGFYGYLSF